MAKFRWDRPKFDENTPWYRSRLAASSAPPTDKQIRFAESLGIKVEGLNKKELSLEINKALAARTEYKVIETLSPRKKRNNPTKLQIRLMKKLGIYKRGYTKMEASNAIYKALDNNKDKK